MIKQKKDPFNEIVLDKYEQEIEDSIPDKLDENIFNISKNDRENFAEIAKKHDLFKVSRRINIRINTYDLARVKSKAKDNNIPYQTLISSIVHKYAKGDLEVRI